MPVMLKCTLNGPAALLAHYCGFRRTRRAAPASPPAPELSPEATGLPALSVPLSGFLFAASCSALICFSLSACSWFAAARSF